MIKSCFQLCLILLTCMSNSTLESSSGRATSENYPTTRRTSSTNSWCASVAATARPPTRTGSSAPRRRSVSCSASGGMIKIINEQADVVAERHCRYRAQDIVAKPATMSAVDPRVEAMYKEVTQLVGIEKPSRELISKLSLSKMVSVVGTGGLGKTTLAKAVYDKLKMYFLCTAFVPVGRDPDFRKVFIDILIELNKDKYMDPKYRLLDPSQLIKEVREHHKSMVLGKFTGTFRGKR